MAFEILSEKDEEIDIDNIEELEELIHIDEYNEEGNVLRMKINELIKAIKQLNKRLDPKITEAEEELLNKHIPRID